EALARHLLGQVWIAEEEEKALDGLPEKEQVILSKSGKIIHGSYTLNGGSVGLFEGNKIGRAKSLERLATEILELTSRTESLKKQISETQSGILGFNQELNDKAIEQTRQDINRAQNQAQNIS